MGLATVRLGDCPGEVRKALRARMWEPTVTPEPPTFTPEPPTFTPELPTVTSEPPLFTPEPPTFTPEPPTVTPEKAFAEATARLIEGVGKEASIYTYIHTSD